MTKESNRSSHLEIFLIYLRLGCLSFGGPVAHLGYLKDQFVSRRRWLDEARYAELLGICQFVPGPSSSQLAFAIGWHREGLRGACAAWLGFTLPSALIMISLAYGLCTFDGSIEPIVNGLLIATVAVVANATLGLGKKLCPDLTRIAIALLSTAIIFLLPTCYTQIVAITTGGALGYILYSRNAVSNTETLRPILSLQSAIAMGALLLYSMLLVASIWMDAQSLGGIYAMHYRVGALVFGGGHVVLPLLNDSIVSGGLVNESVFLAGYSTAQTLPGPLFSLSAFLGTIGGETTPAWLGGLGALIAIFLPGMLLLLGLLPFWNRIRKSNKAQACLTGANAAVVGLLLAALIYPVSTHGINSWVEALVGLLAYIALNRFKLPAWLVLLSCGVIGYVIY